VRVIKTVSDVPLNQKKEVGPLQDITDRENKPCILEKKKVQVSGRKAASFWTPGTFSAEFTGDLTEGRTVKEVEMENSLFDVGYRRSETLEKMPRVWGP